MKPIEIPGYEGQQIAVKVASGFGSSQLFVNGQPAQPGTKKGQYVLYRNDGVQETAYFKGGFPDPVPTLMVGPQAVKLAPPLSGIQWFWSGFPLVLIILGGALGGLLGAGATAINAQIMRSEQIPVIKYLLCGIVSAIAISIWIAIAFMVRR